MTLCTRLFTALPFFFAHLTVTNGNPYPPLEHTRNSKFGTSALGGGNAILSSFHSHTIEITALVQSKALPLGKWILSIQPLSNNGRLGSETSTTYQWLQSRALEKIVNWTDTATTTIAPRTPRTSRDPNQNLKPKSDNAKVYQAVPIHFTFPTKDARIHSISSTSSNYDYNTAHQGRVFWILLFREVETSRQVFLQKLITLQNEKEILTIDVPSEFSKLSSLMDTDQMEEDEDPKGKQKKKKNRFSKRTLIFVLLVTCCLAREAYISLSEDYYSQEEQHALLPTPPLSQVVVNNSQNVSSIFDQNTLDTDLMVLGTVQISNLQQNVEQGVTPTIRSTSLKLESEETHVTISDSSTYTKTAGDSQPSLNSPSLHSSSNRYHETLVQKEGGGPVVAPPQDYPNQFQMSSERTLYPPNVTRKFSPNLFSSPESSLTSSNNRDKEAEDLLRSDLEFIGKKLFQEKECEKEGNTDKSSSPLIKKRKIVTEAVGAKDCHTSDPLSLYLPHSSNKSMESTSSTTAITETQIERDDTPSPQEIEISPLESAVIEVSSERTLLKLGGEKIETSQCASPFSTNDSPWTIQSPVGEQRLPTTVPHVLQNQSQKREISRVYVPCKTIKKSKRITRELQSLHRDENFYQTITSTQEGFDEPNSVLSRLGFTTKRYLKSRKRRRYSKLCEEHLHV